MGITSDSSVSKATMAPMLISVGGLEERFIYSKNDCKA